MTIYKIQTEVYLDNYDKTYYHIFTISPSIHNDSLNAVLKNIQHKRLSSFDDLSPGENINTCKQVLLDPNNKQKYLEIKHTEILFDILIQNGYTIEYDMTKLLKDNKNNSNIVCFVSK